MGHQPIDDIKNIDQVYPFLGELCLKAEELLKTRERILITVFGKSGTGKSTFGRAVRKKGLGKFRAADICVIDDSRMSLDFLKIFRRKVRFRTPPEPDELKPFFDIIPKRKRIVVFISANPLRRISATDILLQLKVDNDLRIQRLADRVGGIDKIAKHNLAPGEISDYQMKAEVIVEGWIAPMFSATE